MQTPQIQPLERLLILANKSQTLNPNKNWHCAQCTHLIRWHPQRNRMDMKEWHSGIDLKRTAIDLITMLNSAQ